MAEKKSLKDKIKVRGNLVLLQEIQRRRTAGGILLTDAETKNPDDLLRFYRVVKVGPGAYNTRLDKRMEIDLKEGDVVLANKDATVAFPEWREQGFAVTQDNNIFIGYEPDEGEIERMESEDPGELLMTQDGRIAPASAIGSHPRLVQ